jgi:hypothetical protein
MTKIITVRECCYCTYRRTDDYEHTCGSLAYVRIIPDMFVIPSWCPLPDKPVIQSVTTYKSNRHYKT